MHEYSIAAEIVRAVLDAVEKKKGRQVLSIHLEVGELHLPYLDQITFLVHQLLRGSPAEAAKIRVKEIEARIRCHACGYFGGIRGDQKTIFGHHVQYPCPQCGSFRITIEKGEECVFKKIKAIGL